MQHKKVWISQKKSTMERISNKWCRNYGRNMCWGGNQNLIWFLTFKLQKYHQNNNGCRWSLFQWFLCDVCQSSISSTRFKITSIAAYGARTKQPGGIHVARIEQINALPNAKSLTTQITYNANHLQRQIHSKQRARKKITHLSLLAMCIVLEDTPSQRKKTSRHRNCQHAFTQERERRSICPQSFCRSLGKPFIGI